MTYNCGGARWNKLKNVRFLHKFIDFKINSYFTLQVFSICITVPTIRGRVSRGFHELFEGDLDEFQAVSSEF